MIEFYRERDEHGYMSNFSKHGFELDGEYWPTSEHYYQAMKSDDAEQQDWVRTAPDPKTAKLRGCTATKMDLRPDWEDVKVNVMLTALRAKFKQNDDIRAQLLATNDEILVEASPWDAVWGTGPRGDGQNLLGYCLMLVRAELRNYD